MQEPTLGRIVHIVWPDGVESPAIITRTNADTINPFPHFDESRFDRWGQTPVSIMEYQCVDVMVFGLVQVYPLYNVPFSENAESMHWHWPER